ncbi:unnamed protein product [Toxocara canis]|uniref:Uncharacterized protein n=1 Tax=Toxocara canis TaxID=6265 RepID=A0A183VBH3_TOXCA|nr:unnamed protein product [Toxocara canis]
MSSTGMPAAEATAKKTTQPVEMVGPPPAIVVRDVSGGEEREPHVTWTKRLSKTIHRRSGSFLNSLVPFRKGDHCREKQHNSSHSPLATPRQRRRASATPTVCYNTCRERTDLHAILRSEMQRRRSADRIYLADATKVGHFFF